MARVPQSERSPQPSAEKVTRTKLIILAITALVIVVLLILDLDK